MGVNSNKKTLGGVYADKLSLVIIVLLIVSIGSLVLCGVMESYFGLGDFLGLGIFILIVLVCLVVPILGLIALLNVRFNWHTIKSSDSAFEINSRIKKIAYRFFIASLIFSLMILLLAILWIFSEETKGMVMPTFISIWLFIIELIALIMAYTSFRLLRRLYSNILLRIVALSPVIISIAAVTFVIGTSSYADCFLQNIRYSNKTPTISGSSGSLSGTVVVPTLDSPCPKNCNVIWCSSFQLAWNELRDNVVKEPVRIGEAQEIADLLNNAKQLQDDIDISSYFVASGFVSDGVDKYIKTEFSRKFPGESVPEFNNLEPLDLIMYAFLIAQAEFKYPFKDYENGISFKDSGGLVSKVAAFGVWEDEKRFDKQRGQIDILYQSPLPDLEASSEESEENSGKYKRYLFSGMEEFAVDLCRDTQPYQIVLARVEPNSTLEFTLTDLQSKMSDFSERDDYEELRTFRDGDTLSVPEMYLEIDHHLEELEGKYVTNPGFGPYPIKRAEQIIHFRLDRNGAVLRSEVKFIITLGKLIGRDFEFDRPFLIYMKKRDRERPFFMMWVDNAELLTKK